MARTILIIDDEESIRTSLKGALEDEGFDVITAEDGESGITRTSEELPDLILLDIWMPGIDGIETLNRLKRLYPKLPIVIMSGHGTIEAADSRHWTSLGDLETHAGKPDTEGGREASDHRQK
ncbi:MAG: sigma-54-dependent transcriptional response regulator [Deltaproteobacteria bacterium]|nr:sigma-54-dependent transcriptional response regulator [Deltaproteobacteria bacterium]